MSLQSSLTRRSVSSAGNRIFVYEVEGFRQNELTDRQDYSVRNSSTVLIQVPYSRMNDEMQRITRLGGKIVGIRPLSESEQPAQPSKQSQEQPSK